MAQQHLNVGTSANDGTGDTLRASQQKAEANFTELYAMSGGGGSVGTLQAVTDNGNETTNPIYAKGEITSTDSSTSKGSGITPLGVVIATGDATVITTIKSDNITTTDRTQQLDDADGTIFVNGLKRDGSNANSNIDIGGYNFTANEIISNNRFSGSGYYLFNDGSGKVGLFATATDELIAVLDTASDKIYKYGNAHITYNETTNSFEWDGNVIATVLDLAGKQDTLTDSNTHTLVDSFTAMTTPVDADKFLVIDNSASLGKKITWGNIKAGLLTYFQGVFALKSDYMALTSAYVLANSTSLQKMFNVGSGSGGAFNTTANKTYKFRIEFAMTGLSSTSGSLSFGFLGTATITSVNYKANTSKQVLLTPASPFLTDVSTASQTVITSSTTGTAAKGIITGIVRCTTAGTLIPAVATSIGVSTAQVEINSYAEFTEIGSNTITATSNIT